jgi:steroid delta-isomerase-like uncharacterized protein
MSDTPGEIARRWFQQVWNQRNESAVAEMMHAECRGRTESGPLVGRAAWVRRIYRPFLAAFPDLRIDLDGVVAEEDEVVVRWRVRGTHRGDALGIPASGLHVSFGGMTWMRIEHGRIIEGEDRWNRDALEDALLTGMGNTAVNVLGHDEPGLP